MFLVLGWNDLADATTTGWLFSLVFSSIDGTIGSTLCFVAVRLSVPFDAISLFPLLIRCEETVSILFVEQPFEVGLGAIITFLNLAPICPHLNAFEPVTPLVTFVRCAVPVVNLVILVPRDEETDTYAISIGLPAWLERVVGSNTFSMC